MFEMLLLALASFRITRFIVKDHLFDSVRNRVWDRFPPETTKTGYLLTCSWCSGFWVSSVLFICYTIVPLQTMWVSCIFALSAVVGWLAAFDDRI